MSFDFIKGVISYDIEGVYYQKSFTTLGKSKISHGKINLIRVGSDIQVYSVLLIPDRHTIISLHNCTLYYKSDCAIESVFSNGYQAWTESREYLGDEILRPLHPMASPWVRKYHLKTHGDQYFFTYQAEPGISHNYTYTYLKTRTSSDNSVSFSLRSIGIHNIHDSNQYG